MSFSEVLRSGGSGLDKKQLPSSPPPSSFTSNTASSVPSSSNNSLPSVSHSESPKIQTKFSSLSSVPETPLKSPFKSPLKIGEYYSMSQAPIYNYNSINSMNSVSPVHSNQSRLELNKPRFKDNNFKNYDDKFNDKKLDPFKSPVTNYINGNNLNKTNVTNTTNTTNNTNTTKNTNTKTTPSINTSINGVTNTTNLKIGVNKENSVKNLDFSTPQKHTKQVLKSQQEIPKTSSKPLKSSIKTNTSQSHVENNKQAYYKEEPCFKGVMNVKKIFSPVIGPGQTAILREPKYDSSVDTKQSKFSAKYDITKDNNHNRFGTPQTHKKFSNKLVNNVNKKKEEPISKFNYNNNADKINSTTASINNPTKNSLISPTVKKGGNQNLISSKFFNAESAAKIVKKQSKNSKINYGHSLNPKGSPLSKGHQHRSPLRYNQNKRQINGSFGASGSSSSSGSSGSSGSTSSSSFTNSPISTGSPEGNRLLNRGEGFGTVFFGDGPNFGQNLPPARQPLKIVQDSPMFELYGGEGKKKAESCLVIDYKELFENLKKRYLCNECHSDEVVRDNVCVPCGHFFCKECISKLVYSGNNLVDSKTDNLTCPKCKKKCEKIVVLEFD